MSKINLYENFDEAKIQKIREKVDGNSTQIDKVVNEIIKPYCKDLDNYVKFIKDCLCDGENPPTTLELEDFCMNLSTFIYFAGGLCEQLGVRDDIGKALYKEMYHTARASQDNGTVADKDSYAELCSQQEQLTSICYTRAYKTMKSKVDNAQEILSSCKKVLSHRMQEESMTNISVR